MRVIVDIDLCGGCGVCEQICPEVFVLSDKMGYVKVQINPIPSQFYQAVSDAVDGCPSGAIRLVDEEQKL